MEALPVQIEIVTPVHNRKSITLQCLRSLSRIDRCGLAVHIIVVDDGSVDGTADAIERNFPDVEVIRESGNLWYAGGTNCGIRAALKRHPNYILAVNDDSIFHDSFLQRLVHCSRQNPKSVIGPLLLLWDRPHQVFQVGPCWDTWYGGWRHPMRLTPWTVPRQAFEVDLIVGNCVLYPVEAILQVGLMKERDLPHCYADAEYTTRMRRSGWKLRIEPSAFVWCKPNNVPTSMRAMRVVTAFKELFFDQHSHRNLVNLVKSRCYTAPSGHLAAAASAIHVFRLGLHGLGLGGSWPDWPDPPFCRKPECP